MQQSGYLPQDFPSLTALVDEADGKLFRPISNNPTHHLHHYFIDKPACGFSLRTQALNFVLPPKDDKNFVLRSTYVALKSHSARTFVTSFISLRYLLVAIFYLLD